MHIVGRWVGKQPCNTYKKSIKDEREVHKYDSSGVFSILCQPSHLALMLRKSNKKIKLKYIYDSLVL